MAGRRARKYLGALSLCFLSACGPNMPDAPNAGTSHDQLKILSIRPEAGGTLEEPDIKLLFSASVDEETVSKQSICLTRFDEEVEPAELAKDLDDDDEICIPCSYSQEGDEKTVIAKPSAKLDAGNYGLLITEKLHSKGGIPFNQGDGFEKQPFWSTFSVSSDIAPAGSAGGDGGPPEDGGTAEGEAETAAAAPPPSWIVINEILYDIKGSDTNGKLFIELNGETGGNIGGYVIAFVNGGDGKVYDKISFDDGTTIPDDEIFLVADKITGGDSSFVADADLIDNFDPQNGPDCVQLIGPGGDLVDAVGYGEGMIATAENGLSCFEGIPAVDAASDMALSRTLGADTNDNSVDFIETEPTPGV